MLLYLLDSKKSKQSAKNIFKLDFLTILNKKHKFIFFKAFLNEKYKFIFFKSALNEKHSF